MQLRDLSAHAEYRAGRGVEEVAREHDMDPEALITLSSNENPLGPSQAAITAIQETAETVHHYPKASHTDLTDAIADMWDVASEQVWLANGGDGALDYLARATLEPGDIVLVPWPGFAYYGMSARYHHGTVRTYPLSKQNDFQQTPGAVLAAYTDERIIYLTSPHNPTGTHVTPQTVETIARQTAPHTLIVVDEAYGEYMDADSAKPLIERRDDVVVLRTFSKAYGLAGCRLGYAIVPAAWADAYARVTTPFAASELACRAGLAALTDQDHVDRSIELARWARNYYQDNLQVPTWESQGNFVLADVDDATRVTNALEERGVIVRDCSSFGLPSCIRITCGTKETTRQATSAINSVVGA